MDIPPEVKLEVVLILLGVGAFISPFYFGMIESRPADSTILMIIGLVFLVYGLGIMIGDYRQKESLKSLQLSIDKYEKLRTLRNEKIMTEEEFIRAKNRIRVSLGFKR